MATVEPGKTRVGWIGTGVMGRWMCEHVMNKGYQVTVYNRTKVKAQPLLDKGAKAKLIINITIKLAFEKMCLHPVL